MLLIIWSHGSQVNTLCFQSCLLNAKAKRQTSQTKEVVTNVYDYFEKTQQV